MNVAMVVRGHSVEAIGEVIRRRRCVTGVDVLARAEKPGHPGYIASE